MRNFLTNRSSGFSLVELLVVATILAALGTGALVALNPIEMRRRARDSERLEDARNLVQSTLRYYSGENCYPWQKNQTTGACSATQTLGGYYVAATRFNSGGHFYPLMAQELKTYFPNRKSIQAQELYVSYESTSGRFSVCFTPESKAGRTGAMGVIKNRSNTAAGTCNNSYSRTQANCNICAPTL